MQTAYKGLTHTFCPPIQGGPPIFDGVLPFTLPPVKVDRSENNCATGWNACATPEQCLKLVGFWPDGWPVRLYRCKTDAEVLVRETKLRAETWTLVEQIPVQPIIETLSQEWFGDLADVMAQEQLAWYEALGRPFRDEGQVVEGLTQALKARGLETWTLRKFPTAWDAWAAWAAWDARDAWATWSTRATRDAWDARSTRATRATRDAWDARSTRAAWDARDARAALMVQYTARNGWIKHDPELLTVGLREAYRHGLALVLPTGPNELGWAMADSVTQSGV